ncbi:MAG: VOC family protein [Leptospiraceae bacterium]|nr:VOC family protein [Leptospiraceae bacterium]MCP5503261.1 VOC family protein [Leptospiraceae bacterium]
MILEGLDHISVAVTDLQRSIAFYTDVFDFEELEKDDTNSFLSFGPFKIKLVKTEKVENHLTAMGQPVMSFGMDVDDFTEAIQELEVRGLKIFEGPEVSGEGEYLLFGDPDNNLIEIFYN